LGHAVSVPHADRSGFSGVDHPQEKGIGVRYFRNFILAGACLVLPILPASSGIQDGRWAILITGVSGDAALQKTYLQELKDLHSTLVGQLQFAGDHIYSLFDDPSLAPDLIRYKSTRENLAKACKEIAGRSGKDHLVFVFIEGHGSYDQKSYKLNLVGPDPDADELADLLYSIPARRFVVINATNTSGASLTTLSGKGKIVICATKSGSEGNQTHFGGFWVDALRNNNADIDKDGRTSIYEAFNYAVQMVERYYTNAGQLQTEHPVLNDNGVAVDQAKAVSESSEVTFARATYLDSGIRRTPSAAMTPEEQQLFDEAQLLERQIELLKQEKAEMDPADYESKLEDLLLRLAQVNAQLPKK
jgi:hypothetical protein